MFDLDISGRLFSIGDQRSGILGDIEIDLTILDTFDAEDVGFKLVLQI